MSETTTESAPDEMPAPVELIDTDDPGTEPPPDWDDHVHADTDAPEVLSFMAAAVHINGFTVSADRNAIGIRSYTVPGTTVVLPVRSEIAPLLIGAAAEFHATVEPLVSGWCWGYAYRNVTGGSTPSFHAAGIAIDLNAPRHPIGKANTFTPAQADRIRAIARKYGLRWGGEYSGRKDAMHLEVILSRAAALDLVHRIQSGGQPTPPSTGRRTLRQGMTGPDVRDVQAKVGATADGVFGPKTTAAVKAFQARHGLTADGIVGPRTWAVLDAPPPPAPIPGARPTVRNGTSGPAVAELQRILNAWYPDQPRLAVDGQFGARTEARVRLLQQRAGLAVDGVCGPRTWAVLLGR